MSKPTPKGNFLQTFLIVTTLWLGMYIFIILPQQQKQKELPQKPEDLYKVLVDHNKAIKDQTIVHLANSYNNLLQEQLKEKKVTEQQVNEQKLAAAVLVADTQLKAGIQRNDVTRVRAAYTTLHNYLNQFRNTPVWTEKSVDVPDDQRFNTTSWTPGALYERAYDELAKRNRTSLVYGIFPGYQIIDSLVALTGKNPTFSYAFACFLLAFIVRAVVFPLSERQLRFSRQMSQLAPLTNEVRKEYKDDPQQVQLKVMEIYKEYGINPLAGCFPALLQLPLFLTVYQFMLAYQFAFRNGTFLWINEDISARTGGWTAPNLGELDYPLIFIYGITMLISTLLAPISDPSQAKQQRLMTVGITVMFTVFMFFWPLPSAFVLYWTFTNLLSMAQSIRAYRSPLPPLEKVNAAGGGVHPKNPVGGKWMKMMEEMQRQAAEQAAQNAKPSDAKNGSAKKPGSGQVISNGEVKKGTPAKHKPKKRK
jgi:YidC/Oxa1 family membrane protein insertase